MLGDPPVGRRQMLASYEPEYSVELDDEVLARFYVLEPVSDRIVDDWCSDLHLQELEGPAPAELWKTASQTPVVALTHLRRFDCSSENLHVASD